MTYSAEEIFRNAWGAGGHRPTPDQILGGVYPDAAAALAAHFREDPEPLGGVESEPTRLNIPQALPEGLAQFVTAVSEHLEIPPEATAFMTIAALSAAAVGRYRIDGGGGWTQPLILWMAAGLLPGERKSDLVRITSGPLRREEIAAGEAHKINQREADLSRELLEANIHDLKEQMRKKPNSRTALEAELEVEQKKLDDLPEKDAPPPRVLVDNTTPEALSNTLAKNHEALAALSAEGDIFAVIAGRYSNGGSPNFELHLRCYDEEYIAFDRIQRGTIILKYPALAMGMCVQPDVIHKVAEIPGARERGFLGRWFYTIPPSNLGHRKNLRLPLDPAYVQWWSDILGNIRQVAPRQDPPPILRLSAGADAILQSLLDHIEPHLEATFGQFSHMSDWASKLSGKTLRLAGVLHLGQGLGQHQAVSDQTMNQAVAFSLWSIREAERVYQAWQREELGAGVGAILTWIRRKKPAVFTATDLKNSLRKSPWYSTDARDAALVALHNARWIASVVQVDSSGRARATCEFVPNPALWGAR